MSEEIDSLATALENLRQRRMYAHRTTDNQRTADTEVQQAMLDLLEAIAERLLEEAT